MEDLGDSNRETLNDRMSSIFSITCAGRLRALTQRLAREPGLARLCRRTPYTSRPLPPPLTHPVYTFNLLGLCVWASSWELIGGDSDTALLLHPLAMHDIFYINFPLVRSLPT